MVVVPGHIIFKLCAVKIIFTTYVKKNAYITVVGLLLTKKDKSLMPFMPNL